MYKLFIDIDLASTGLDGAREEALDFLEALFDGQMVDIFIDET